MTTSGPTPGIEPHAWAWMSDEERVAVSDTTQRINPDAPIPYAGSGPQYLVSTSDPEPHPGDGPDYHADHAVWSQRHPTPGVVNGVCLTCGSGVLDNGEHIEPERHPTPGDHDELLKPDGFRRRYNFHYSELIEYGANETGRHVAALDRLQEDVAAALRTEQSSRQQQTGVLESLGKIAETACEAAATACNERDVLQQRIDAAPHAPSCRSNEDQGDDDAYPCDCWKSAPTESKEPDPKLDPEPWVTPIGQPYFRYAINRTGMLRFKPRCWYSQNPADYGIEAPHE